MDSPVLVSSGGFVFPDAAAGVFQQAVVLTAAAVVGALRHTDALARADRAAQRAADDAAAPFQRPQQKAKDPRRGGDHAVILRFQKRLGSVRGPSSDSLGGFLGVPQPKPPEQPGVMDFPQQGFFRQRAGVLKNIFRIFHILRRGIDRASGNRDRLRLPRVGAENSDHHRLTAPWSGAHRRRCGSGNTSRRAWGSDTPP